MGTSHSFCGTRCTTVLEPEKRLRYTLCPFCRKARGKIQSVSRKQFEGTCPNCGASGPKHENEQLARRAWNGGKEKVGPSARTDRVLMPEAGGPQKALLVCLSKPLFKTKSSCEVLPKIDD